MSKSLYLLAEASEDETGASSSGFLGDQSGFELRAREWYDHVNGWGKLFRFNNPDIAEEIASRAESAVTNGFIGYDTAQRETLRERLEEVDYVVDALESKCGCDCSALAYSAIYGATKVPYDYSVRQYPAFCNPQNNLTPKVRDFDDYIERQLVKAGFGITVFTLQTAVPSYTGDAEYTEVTFDDGTTLDYPYPHYDTPYDRFDSVADPAIVQENLNVIYLNQPNTYGYDETFLTTFLTYGNPKESAWKRGDIIRTLGRKKSNGSQSGHMVIWL